MKVSHLLIGSITITEIDVYDGLDIDHTIPRAAALRLHFKAANIPDTHNLLIVEEDKQHTVVGFGDYGHGLVDLSRSIFAATPRIEKFALIANGVMSLQTRKLSNPESGDGSFRFAKSRNVVQVAEKDEYWQAAVDAWAKTFNPPISFEKEEPASWPTIKNYIFNNERDITAFCAALDKKDFDFAAEEIKKQEMGFSTRQEHYIDWDVKDVPPINYAKGLNTTSNRRLG